MCKCLEVVGRIVIGILSVLFAILGFALLIIGILVKVNSSAINNLFNPLLESVKSQASSAAGGSLNLPTDNFNIADLVGGLAIAFIVLGVVILIIGVLGVAGACCKVKCMIILYLIVMVLLLISQIIMVIIIAVNRPILTDPPKASLKTTLQAEYQGVNGTDVTSLLWNVVMNGLQCCGIDNSTDFDTATKWQNVWAVAPTSFQTPVACCKTGQFSSSSATCASSPTAATNNMATGCYEKIWDFIFKGTTFIIFAVADIGGFAVLTFFAGVILYGIVQKNKVANMV